MTIVVVKRFTGNGCRACSTDQPSDWKAAIIVTTTSTCRRVFVGELNLDGPRPRP